MWKGFGGVKSLDMAEKREVGVTLLGCGTVGGGVVNVLTEQREMLRRRTGIDFALRHVVVKSEAEYPPNASELPMSTDAASAIDDPKTDVVIELIGGTGVAFTFVIDGTDVATATSDRRGRAEAEFNVRMPGIAASR